MTAIETVENWIKDNNYKPTKEMEIFIKIIGNRIETLEQSSSDNGFIDFNGDRELFALKNILKGLVIEAMEGMLGS